MILDEKTLHDLKARQAWLRAETQRINDVFRGKALAADVKLELAKYKAETDFELARVNGQIKDHNRAEGERLRAKAQGPADQEVIRRAQEASTPRTDTGSPLAPGNPRPLTQGEFFYRKARQLQRAIARVKNPAEHLIYLGQALALFLEDQATFLLQRGEGDKVGLTADPKTDEVAAVVASTLTDAERRHFDENVSALETHYNEVWFGERGFKP
jgi:hypothetical protein